LGRHVENVTYIAVHLSCMSVLQGAIQKRNNLRWASIRKKAKKLISNHFSR
jgi:hypothetical protein